MSRPDNHCSASEEAQSGQDTTPSDAAGEKWKAGARVATESFLFDDPYWDEVFDSYHNRTLRTCCHS